MELGRCEIFPVVRNVPLLFGLMATDPTIDLYEYLKQIRAEGFAGVVNFPTIALTDGKFSAALEDEDETRQRLDAGADVICVHRGLTRGGFLGAKKYISIVDVAGLNKISKMILSNALLAIVGMVNLRAELKTDKTESKPLIAASIFGVTTPCVDRAKNYLERRGYEVLVFHGECAPASIRGTGGKTMDALINAGFFAGVLAL